MVAEMVVVAGVGDPTSGCAWKNNAKKITTKAMATTMNTTTEPTEEAMMMDPTDTTRLSSFTVGGFVVPLVVGEEWVEAVEAGAVDALVVAGDLVAKILLRLPVVLLMEQTVEPMASNSKETTLVGVATQWPKLQNTIPPPWFKLPTAVAAMDTNSKAAAFEEEDSVDEGAEEALQVVHMS
jgi:hypothetical protein